MNTALQTRIQSLTVGAAQGRAGLQIVPLLGPDQEGPIYLVLDSKTCTKVQVTEVSEGGHVPELQITNTSSKPVFLMDGQELVGAKQNRILNTDVLVPPKKELKVPVSCVEAGRWHYTTMEFSPGKAASHTVRARKQQRVHAALIERGAHDADQAAVWNDVAHSMERAQAASPTSALSDAYAHRVVELERINAELTLPDDAVGLAVLHGKQLLGLDLFDRHSTLQHYWRSLIDSYAIDWLNAATTKSPATKTLKPNTKLVHQALEAAATANWADYEPPGLGTEYRFSDSAYSGASLVWNEAQVVHLTLFPGAPTKPTPGQEQASRPKIRRRYPRSGS